MVTHDMGEAGFFGDRVLLLSDGRIVQDGLLDDLIHKRPMTTSPALSTPNESQVHDAYSFKFGCMLDSTNDSFHFSRRVDG